MTLRLPRWLTVAAAAVCLVALLSVALSLRMKGMYPPDQALLYNADYDEGVHIAGAQLMLQGYVPYRDFMFLQPPFALFLFAGIAKLHFVPWGDTTLFVLARYTAIAFSLLAILAVFAAAFKLGGIFSGLLAAGLLAIDAVVIETDRRAMLEPFANALSVLTILCYLMALGREKSRTRWLVATGVMGAIASLTKTTAALSLFAVLAYAFIVLLQAGVGALRRRDAQTRSVLRRRLAELATMALCALVTGAAIAGYFIWTSSSRFFQQVYFFHLVRPLDGTIDVPQRFVEIMGYSGAYLTVYVALAGMALLVVRVLFRGYLGHWGVVVIWAAAVVALFATSRTYFPHYYVQLAMPLAILAGAVASTSLKSSSTSPLPNSDLVRISSNGGSTRNSSADSPTARPSVWSQARAVVPLVVQVAVLGFALWAIVGAAPRQYAQAENVIVLRSANLADVAKYLATQTPPGATVLGLQPIYAVAGSRPPAGPDAKSPLVDSYGFILYTNVGMEDELIPQASDQTIWDAVHGADAQSRIVEIARQADYIVVDRQARWELNPDVLDAMLAGRRQVFESGKVTIHARK